METNHLYLSFCGERGIRTPGTGKSVRQFSKLLVSATHPSHQYTGIEPENLSEIICSQIHIRTGLQIYNKNTVLQYFLNSWIRSHHWQASHKSCRPLSVRPPHRPLCLFSLQGQSPAPFPSPVWPYRPEKVQIQKHPCHRLIQNHP